MAFLQAGIHVGGAEAKRLCVLAWRWKGGALHGGARERSAACARACLQLNGLRNAGGGGTERARRELSDGCCCDGDAKGR